MSEPTYEELKAKLSQLEKEVETKKRSGDLIFKVGEKGGVSVYGQTEAQRAGVKRPLI
jgi:hypothetical protein